MLHLCQQAEAQIQSFFWGWDAPRQADMWPGSPSHRSHPKVLLGFVAERESRARVSPSRADCSPFAPGTLIFQLVVKSGVLAGARSFLSKCPLWLNENQYLAENYLSFFPPF